MKREITAKEFFSKFKEIEMMLCLKYNLAWEDERILRYIEHTRNGNMKFNKEVADYFYPYYKVIYPELTKKAIYVLFEILEKIKDDRKELTYNTNMLLRPLPDRRGNVYDEWATKVFVKRGSPSFKKNIVSSKANYGFGYVKTNGKWGREKVICERRIGVIIKDNKIEFECPD